MTELNKKELDMDEILEEIKDNEEVRYIENIPKGIITMKVYRHDATYKGAKKGEYYYTATNSKGINMVLNFKYIDLPEIIENESVFIIACMRGGKSCKTIVKDGIEYTNTTIYVKSAIVSKVPIDNIDL